MLRLLAAALETKVLDDFPSRLLLLTLFSALLPRRTLMESLEMTALELQPSGIRLSPWCDADFLDAACLESNLDTRTRY